MHSTINREERMVTFQIRSSISAKKKNVQNAQFFMIFISSCPAAHTGSRVEEHLEFLRVSERRAKKWGEPIKCIGREAGEQLAELTSSCLHCSGLMQGRKGTGF